MNQQLAIIGQNFVVSWFAIFCFLGCFAGFLTAIILRKRQKQQVSDVFVVVTFAVPFGLILGRLFYCLFAARGYGSIGQMFRLSVGGYGLYGAISGVFLAAVLTKKLFDVNGWEELLDCLAIGGALAIAVGRFATYFSGAEIGYEVPFKALTVYKLTDQLHLLAVYWLDGIYETVICLAGFLFYRFIRRHYTKNRIGGLTAMLMLALHGTNVAIMESLRSDALTFGPNQMFKISQILGIGCCVAVAGAFIVMTLKSRGFRLFDLLLGLVMIGCIVLAGYAEWRVGKSDYIYLHLVMLACMLVLDVITVHLGLSVAKNAGSLMEETAEETEKAAAPEKQSPRGSRKKTSIAKGRRRISKNEADSIMAAFKDAMQNEDESLL